MYTKIITPSALFLLVACSGNPLNNVPSNTNNVGPVNTLPGTTSPSRTSNIQRYEAQTPDGSGYAENVTYDAGTDTFTVDNLAFDGDNAYARGTAVSDLSPAAPTTSPFAVYEGPATEPDQFTGTPIAQFNHRAIHAVSASGRTDFSIIRTGAYASYGFGGFVYNRTGSVSIPTSGQAIYLGDYAAIRDFNGRPGLEYATGNMQMTIDFNDFNTGSGVSGTVYNRSILDVNGNDITAAYLAELSADAGVAVAQLPAIVFTVGPGVIDSNGELQGSVTTPYLDDTGSIQDLGPGTYYAVLAGPQGREVTGIIVTEGDDPRYDGVTTRETGGFILVNN